MHNQSATSFASSSRILCRAFSKWVNPCGIWWENDFDCIIWSFENSISKTTTYSASCSNINEIFSSSVVKLNGSGTSSINDSFSVMNGRLIVEYWLIRIAWIWNSMFNIFFQLICRIKWPTRTNSKLTHGACARVTIISWHSFASLRTLNWMHKFIMQNYFCLFSSPSLHETFIAWLPSAAKCYSDNSETLGKIECYQWNIHIEYVKLKVQHLSNTSFSLGSPSESLYVPSPSQGYSVS